ncbi:MAG: hypothetical protein HZA53_08055 [Planctomycetes bacterium]|nr:hypothetical protein [Planctomycetota bacterium]
MQNHHPVLWNHGPNTLTVAAPTARAVLVAGPFNGWNTSSHPMQRRADGTWALPLELPPGHYEFKFLIDGAWCCMPECGATCTGCPGCVPNEFGTMNRILEVADHRVGAGPLSVSRPDCRDRATADAALD